MASGGRLGPGPPLGAAGHRPGPPRLVASGRASVQRGSPRPRAEKRAEGAREGAARPKRGPDPAAHVGVVEAERHAMRLPGVAVGVDLQVPSRDRDSPEQGDRPAQSPTRWSQAARRTCDLDEELAMAVLEQDLHQQERRQQHEAQLRAEDELLAMVLALSLAEDASGRIQQEAEMALSGASSRARAAGRAAEVRARLPVQEWQAGSSSTECALCLDEFSPGDKVTRLFCFHAFHSDCLEPWLRRSETCPTCKRHLLDHMEPE
ncbi:RNF13 [Symbiodinium sp. CCMP2592]|nr:RNF13 [Symbiodinium sp. CCMP2592]